MTHDRMFGFDTTQKQTLQKLLAEAGTSPALEQRLADLEARIEALEEAQEP